MLQLGNLKFYYNNINRCIHYQSIIPSEFFSLHWSTNLNFILAVKHQLSRPGLFKLLMFRRKFYLQYWHLAGSREMTLNPQNILLDKSIWAMQESIGLLCI